MALIVSNISCSQKSRLFYQKLFLVMLDIELAVKSGIIIGTALAFSAYAVMVILLHQLI